MGSKKKKQASKKKTLAQMEIGSNDWSRMKLKTDENCYIATNNLLEVGDRLVEKFDDKVKPKSSVKPKKKLL